MDMAEVPLTAPPSKQQPEVVELVDIPAPETLAQLEQLLNRYRAIFEDSDTNRAEINSLERVFSSVSKQQDQYITKLQELRHAMEKEAAYDEQVFQNQLIALQLLSKDMDVPSGLLESPKTSPTDSVQHTTSTISQCLQPLKVSLNFDENAKSFGLRDKFFNFGVARGKKSLGVPVVEATIVSRIAERISDLERLPASLGTYSLLDSLQFTAKDDVPSSVDDLKLRALVELKALKMLTKQKSLRQKLIMNVTSQAHHTIPCLRDSPFTMAAQRSVQVRNKVIVPQTARLAEELERQQLLEKRRKERNLHMHKVNKIIEHVHEQQVTQSTQRERSAQFGRLCASLHNQTEKDEQKRVERTAKQRLQALKSNDEEAYLKLLDQTKDTRITHLLRQTNTFLDSLAQAVKVQQNEAKMKRGEEAMPMTDEERENIDYYEVAHSVKEKVEKQPSMLIGGTLKEYQIKGLEWMVSLYNNHLNGILADEMGLGKTIQSISLITYLRETKNEPGPFLVIVPLSTITNWTLEFEKWAPTLSTIIYKGTPNQRKSMQHQIRFGNFEVLLTTYEYIIKDRSLLAKHDWSHMIIDEGHRMKNAQSKLSFTLTRYYKTRNRLILTGTPLQNNLPELWALLNFVLPKIFNSAKTFDEWFNTPFANTGGQEKLELTEEETLLVIRRLHKVLRPFLLRRLKKEVEKDLPDKVEKVIKCKLSGLQQQLYEQMLKHNALFVGAGTEGATKGGIKGLNNKIMQLRKICNHPFVFDEVEGIINPTRSNSPLLYRVAGKFELLDRILPKFKATGHRILMFFQMTQVMDIMEDFLRMRDFKYLRLDGATKTEDRTGMLKDFNAPDSEYFCFLLSTRAGGLGLNLQTADTVIIFDTDWNPHQDLQAQDRAHRIGQKNEVRILRLITTDSVEEVILERALKKLDIDGKVIQAGKFDNKSTAEEQEAFLRRLLENETVKDENEKAELDDEELNEILARGEKERELFDQMDIERAAIELKLAKAQGLSAPLPRLIETNELPDVLTEDINDHLNIEPAAVGRIRERKKVYYDDGLTEEQWLQAVDDDDDSLEEVISRKRQTRERRQINKLAKDSEIDEIDTLENSLEPTPETDGAKIIEEAEKRPRPKRKAAEDEYLQEEEPLDEIENLGLPDGQVEPAPKKQKLKVKLSLKKKEQLPPDVSDKSGEPDDVADGKKDQKSSAVPRPKSKPSKKPVACEFTPRVEQLFEKMRGMLDPQDEHPRTSVFETLPSKKLYPDYYALIKTPVALDSILKKCKRGQYESMSDVHTDLNVMFDNAQFYNEEGSWIFNDAGELRTFVSNWFAASNT
ncbi:LANO_0H07778g1_1 [Lachancea nothofagi CBS 11611]|uniref:LANO_0H07778g1_1 n=1 Tax=Lachancea nothofagi CBS 11611 TaxID=1266666 RepID=A0A1G4KLU7_9SACH|nr:LANO_0H07778g1_1 [Lachancea nothofagi CBS 11611]